jgi:hypothetical protein
MNYSYKISEINALQELLNNGVNLPAENDLVEILNNDSLYTKLSDEALRLKSVMDSLIELNINFEILNFPYCHFLGYKRYIRKTVSNSDKNILCLECDYVGVCPGFNPLYLEVAGIDEIKPISFKNHVTDNEICMLEILKYKNNISTSEVLELVRLFPICNDCSTGAHVIAAGQKLIQKGIIGKNLTDNGYIWSLISER